MAGRARTAIDLRVGAISEADLRVRSVRGREALSEPFAFEVEVGARSGDAVDLTELTGKEALLVIRRAGGEERLVHGVAAAAELAGLRVAVPWYRVRIVPALALLAHRRRSRVYQGQSAPDVVRAVLREAGVAHRAALQASYPKREMCVQYRESTLDFVQRLLEEEGIFYFFEHAEDGHTVVLGDSPGAFGEIGGDPVVPFRPGAAQVDDEDVEHVTSAARRDARCPASAALRDYDFLRPELDLTATVSAGGEGAEIYEYGLRYADPAALRRLATVRLEEARTPQVEWSGDGTCLRFQPGAVFELDHPDAKLGGRLRLAAVEHEARQGESAGAAEALAHDYRNRFRAHRAGMPYRPARRTPRPVVFGVQSATVVGPAGEEIHVDEHGRIKVQFHWDREGARDERSSCFVRVAQAWAGPGMGASFVPRIGQEVVVRFLDGDPDRPLVAGAVYEGTRLPPVALPASKTQSTIRSDSSPGGEGSNELRFEDAKGAEEVTVHAQRDANVVVEVDELRRVGETVRVNVAVDRTEEVSGERTLQLTGADAIQVGGAQSVTVRGDRRARVDHGDSETVRGAQASGVGGSRWAVVERDAATSVDAAARVTVGAFLRETAGTNRTLAVGGDVGEQVAGSHSVRVGADAARDVVGSADARVGGDERVECAGEAGFSTAGDRDDQVAGSAAVELPGVWTVGAKKIEITGLQSFALEVGGKPILRMQSGGEVEFGAALFRVEADDIAIKGATVAKESAATLSGRPRTLSEDDEPPDLRILYKIDTDAPDAKDDTLRLESEDGSYRHQLAVSSLSEKEPDWVELVFPLPPAGARLNLIQDPGDGEAPFYVFRGLSVEQLRKAQGVQDELARGA